MKMRPTDRPTNGRTKRGVESRSTRLKIYRYLVACTQLYTPLCLSLTVSQSVGWLVGRSVTFYSFMIFIFGPHCSCRNGLVTSNVAPAHPHATSVSVHPALFFAFHGRQCTFFFAYAFSILSFVYQLHVYTTSFAK